MQHAAGSRHVHLAGWQLLQGGSVQRRTARDWNLQMYQKRCVIQRAVASKQEARKGMIHQFIPGMVYFFLKKKKKNLVSFFKICCVFVRV